jgi:hypothetical protein
MSLCQRPTFLPTSADAVSLPGISSAFALLSRTPGNVTHVLLTRAPLYSWILLPIFPLDLHVLSTPPAFVLSQDQTLHLKPMMTSLPKKTGSSARMVWSLVATR